MSIPVSKKHGINPAITVCEWCGKELNEIALVGRCNKIQCLHCNRIIYGTKKGLCPGCGSNNLKILEYDVEVPRHIFNGLCHECTEKKAVMDKEVSEGGIYFKCTDCGSTGIIKKDHPLSKAVREKMDIKAPNPCGISFDKNDCPVCRKE